MGKDLLGLVFLLWMFPSVKGNNIADTFVGDILLTFGLISPTIVYKGEEAPEICMTHSWALCLDIKNDPTELADRISMLHKQRKQDSVFFVQTNEKLLGHLARQQPSLFRSNCPVFMPLEFSGVIQLRLDTNVLFFREKNMGYDLVDLFALNGGPPITLEVGGWDTDNRLRLEKSMNRWDRRTDMMGATLRNGVWLPPDPAWAEAIYEGDTIVGTKGWWQEKLFYITDRMNFTFEHFAADMLGCTDLLVKNVTDVCSVSRAHRPNEPTSHSIGTLGKEHQANTLFVGIQSGNTPQMSMFIEVFGLEQWMIFLGLLTTISLAFLLGYLALEGKTQDATKMPVYHGFIITSLYVIQQGEHPDKRYLAMRFLSITTSMLTLLMYVLYCNDITAKMTAGTKISIRSFEDVLEQGYRVIAVGPYHPGLLKESKIGTAKRDVYDLYFGEDFEESDKYILSPETMDWAAETKLRERNTLWYCASYCLYNPIYKGKIEQLKMDDAYYVNFGFHFGADSEYRTMFNHYLLKEHEHGILKRLEKFYYPRVNAKIGIDEPQPLDINNVLFLFTFLGAGITLSMIMAAAENVVNNIKLIARRRKNIEARTVERWRGGTRLRRGEIPVQRKGSRP